MKQQILTHIIATNMFYQSNGVTGIGSITRKFNITKYKARKLIKELITENKIELAVAPGGWTEDGEIYPPYKGYRVTKPFKESDLYKQLNAESIEAYARLCVGY